MLVKFNYFAQPTTKPATVLRSLTSFTSNGIFVYILFTAEARPVYRSLKTVM